MRRRRAAAKESRTKSGGRQIEGDVDDDFDDYFGDLSDDVDDFSRYESSRRRRLRNRVAMGIRPPPVITFAELYEQALTLHKQR